MDKNSIFWTKSKDVFLLIEIIWLEFKIACTVYNVFLYWLKTINHLIFLQ